MSTAANGVSLLGLQEQMNAQNANMAAIMGAVQAISTTVAGLGGGQQPAVVEAPVVARAPKAKGRKVATAVAQVVQAQGVPVVTGLPAYSGKGKSNKSEGFELRDVQVLATMPDGTPIKMGVSLKGGFGFQIGEGRAKYAMGAKWLVISQLGPQIAAYVNARTTESK